MLRDRYGNFVRRKPRRFCQTCANLRVCFYTDSRTNKVHHCEACLEAHGWPARREAFTQQ